MIHFLATSGFNPADPSTWAQAGAIAVVALIILTLFLKGMIVPGPTHKNLEERYERLETRNLTLETQNNQIHDRLEGEVFDTLKAAVVALSNSNELVRGTLRGGRASGNPDA